MGDKEGDGATVRFQRLRGRGASRCGVKSAAGGGHTCLPRQQTGRHLQAALRRQNQVLPQTRSQLAAVNTPSLRFSLPQVSHKSFNSICQGGHSLMFSLALPANPICKASHLF